jgi:hypothetical protein
MDNSDGLQDAEAAKRDERDALIGLLAPDSDDLRNKEESVAEKPKAEDDGDSFLHGLSLAQGPRTGDAGKVLRHVSLLYSTQACGKLP